MSCFLHLFQIVIFTSTGIMAFSIVTQIARDGADEFHVTYLIEGREINVHFTADDKYSDSGYRSIRSQKRIT